MTNRLVIGLKTGTVKIVPYTPAQEREKNHRQAVEAKRKQLLAASLTRVTALVPSWTSHAAVERNEELQLLDTPQKQLASRISKYARQSHKKMRRMPLARIAAADPALADPFGDGDGWPT